MTSFTVVTKVVAVCAQCSECQREEIQKARVNGGRNYDSKNENSLFEPPFWALRGNVCTPSMARWKARGRLYIRRN